MCDHLTICIYLLPSGSIVKNSTRPVLVQKKKNCITIIFIEIKNTHFFYKIGVEFLNYTANNVGTNRTLKHNVLCKFKFKKSKNYFI